MEQRIALWDNLKFFLVTCVVIGHFADQFTDVSYVYDSIFLFRGCFTSIKILQERQYFL